MKTEHDSFLAYYLMQDDESANRFKKDRASMAPYEVPSEDQASLVPFLLPTQQLTVLSGDRI